MNDSVSGKKRHKNVVSVDNDPGTPETQIEYCRKKPVSLVHLADRSQPDTMEHLPVTVYQRHLPGTDPIDTVQDIDSIRFGMKSANLNPDAGLDRGHIDDLSDMRIRQQVNR